MPVKRRAPKRAQHPITPEAIDAFRKQDSLRLKRALGLKPWQGSPLEVAEGKRPVWFNEADWRLQHELRSELEAADAG